MTPEKTVLLLGATSSVIQKAKALGLDVILIQHKTKYGRPQADLADLVVIADFTDWAVVEPIAAAVHATWGFAAAISLTDPGVLAAARINDEYGLGGTSHEVVHRFMDKLTMRRRLAEFARENRQAENGPAVIGSAPLVDRAGLEAFAARYGYPVIVKPSNAAASLGIHFVEGPEQIDDVLAQVADLQAHGTQRGCGGLFRIGDHVMEEYASGQEFSVEAFSFGGRHVVVAVTEKLVGETHFAELGHTMPARVDDATAAALADATERFLDVMGLTDGPSHTEVRFGPRGPVIIESHNRIGGDRLDDIVAAIYGVDLKTLALGWPFGLVEELPGRPVNELSACLRVVPAPPGRVTAIHGVDELRAHPDTIFLDVDVAVGDLVPEVRDNHDRVGWLAITGPDGDAATKLCEELVHQTLKIEVTAP